MGSVRPMTTEPEMDVEDHITEVEEMLVRPGTYFNPQTEVLVVVDDSASMDQTIFNMEAYEGAEWVHISDEVPTDEERRDDLLLDFQTRFHPEKGAASETDLAEADEETGADEPADTEPVIEGEGEPAEEGEL
jgi:hypothetical protein